MLTASLAIVIDDDCVLREKCITADEDTVLRSSAGYIGRAESRRKQHLYDVDDEKLQA